jgi:transposase
LRDLIADSGAEAIIPSNRTRKVLIPHDAMAYKLRNRIERFFNKLKHFRRIATRYASSNTSAASPHDTTDEPTISSPHCISLPL